MMDLLAFLRPPDKSSPAEVRRWQWNVALFLLVLGACAGWAISPFGFARASDVDAKVESAVAPMRKEMAAIQAEQQTQRTLLEQTREMAITSQAADYEARIVEFKSRMCKAQSDDAVATWRALVLDYQNRYLALTGRNFPIPSCADL